MQKMSEELAGFEIYDVGGIPAIVIKEPEWLAIIKRIASLEHEVEGERDISRKLGKANIKLESTVRRLVNERVSLKAEIKRLRK